MALAVRRGELKRSDVWKEVLDIADGDMTDAELEAFAKHRTSSKEHVSEGEEPEDPTLDAEKVKSYIEERPAEGEPGDSPITKYLKNLQYSGKMQPIISVSPMKRYVFLVVKPGFCKMAQEVIQRFEDAGFSLYKTHTKMLSEREAKLMYKVHEKEDFYGALCKYMSDDFSIGILMEYPSNWTEKQAFDKTEELKEEIRKDYQESDMRNVLHSSDNIQNMRLESSMYFNELI